MQVMKERHDKRQLSGVVQIDDVYYSGELHSGKRDRGSENKTPFIAAVSTNEKGHPIYMNFNVVKGFRLSEVARWAKKHLAEGSLLYVMDLFALPRLPKQNVNILVPLLVVVQKVLLKNKLFGLTL